MGANAQTSVPVFTAGQVLTAQQQTEINTGIPVFATTTTRDAAFGGTGEKTLAEGQMAYIENIAGSAAVQYYDGAAWQTLVVSGLTRVGGGTLSSTTTAFANVFSATYDSYLITLSNITSVTADQWIQMTMTGTATGYYFGANTVTYSGASASALSGSNVASWQYIAITGSGKTNGATIMLHNPFLSKETTMSYQSQWATTTGYSINGAGFLNNTTSYTGFTLTSASGNFGGTVNVYGLALS